MRCESLIFDQTQLMSEKTKKNTTKPVAAVFGSTGCTGRFVSAELLRREMTPIALARDAEALATTDFPDGQVMSRHRHSESSSQSWVLRCCPVRGLASDLPMIVRNV
jgi:hypothetical protein